MKFLGINASDIVNIIDEVTKKPIEAVLLDSIGTHDEVY